MSNELITEFSTSFTSPEILASISPFLSSEKNSSGKESILSLILFLISFTTPVRIGIIKYEPKYAEEVFKRVIIIKAIANIISV